MAGALARDRRRAFTASPCDGLTRCVPEAGEMS